MDVARYANGAKRLENCYPVVQGGAMRRPGTRYVTACKYADRRARLIPFIFSEEQAYILEFGHQYLRVYFGGAQIATTGGLPYEIATPYTEDMLDYLDYVQGADTMFIAHYGVPIQRLRRLAHDNWQLQDAPFVVQPFDEVGLLPAVDGSLSATGVGTATLTVPSAVFLASDVGRIVSYQFGAGKITAVASATSATINITSAFAAPTLPANAWKLQGSPQSQLTPSVTGPVGAAVTLTAPTGTPAFRTTDVGSYIEINGGLILLTAVASATSASGIVESVLTATVAAPANAWRMLGNVWTAANGYPSAATLNQQRLVAAGSPAYPQTVWLSRSGEYLNFQLGTQADDAFAIGVASDQINPIMFIANVQELVALTYGGEFTIMGGIEKPLSPTNVQIKNQSVYGCSLVKPNRIGNELYFIQRAGRKLRAMAYQYQQDAYGSPDISVLAEHCTQSGIIAMAFQQEPDSLLWMIRGDGEAATLTVDRDQDVVGWARQLTDGAFESIACIPQTSGEQVWLIVSRTINGASVRYVERIDAALNTDAAITGHSTEGASTWYGLTHLEGRQVQIVADGIVMQPQTVVGGSLTLPRTAHEVEIGLGYTTTIEPLTPEVTGGAGTAQGSSMRVAEVTLRVLETTGATINGQIVPFTKLASDMLASTPEPYTGDVRLETLGWDRGKVELVIQQEQPLPFHLLAVIKRFTTNDG